MRFNKCGTFTRRASNLTGKLTGSEVRDRWVQRPLASDVWRGVTLKKFVHCHASLARGPEYHSTRLFSSFSGVVLLPPLVTDHSHLRSFREYDYTEHLRNSVAGDRFITDSTLRHAGMSRGI